MVGTVWILTQSIKMGIVTCGTILSLTADDEVFQGQLQDPGRKMGQSLLTEARGPDRTQHKRQVGMHWYP